ncbi:MAG: NUDIX domain-containing protein, partial [Pirellulales bacterium]|nr:NUDIX domain-containing protein [Pirellulales bacterium]
MLEIAPTPGRRGAIGVVLRDERFLLIRRSAHVIAPRRFCFPGGGIHPGESEADALVREFQEELSVRVRPLRRIWRSVTPWQVRLSWWLAELI